MWEGFTAAGNETGVCMTEYQPPACGPHVLVFTFSQSLKSELTSSPLLQRWVGSTDRKDGKVYLRCSLAAV